MLDELITAHRADIVARCKSRNTRWAESPHLESELSYGIPLFLDQLVDALATGSHPTLTQSSTRHAEALWRRNFTIAEVVRDYGSVCQVITEIAMEVDFSVATAEFRILNRCLDEAIAEAVTEFTRLQDDVGRERLGQLASDRMASVGMLAAGIVHEINNPLTAIIANLALAADHADQGVDSLSLKSLREELQDSIAAAERIRQIVRNVRVFSACNVFERQVIDIEPVLESSLRISSNEVRHRARLVRDYAPMLSPVDADESQLGQVFLNLLVNAAQSIEEGHARDNEIAVTTRMEAGQVIVEIRDSGVGISADAVPKLFTPFFTTKESAVGTGLGLSICHRIISDMHGTITVSSTVGGGSTFRVSLPAANAADVRPPKTAIAALMPTRSGRVLFIDDEVLLCKTAFRILSGQHDVVHTTSAREALGWIGAGQIFDVILCDLMMPDLTGQEFYVALHSTAPALAERIIFMTGGAFTARASGFLSEVQNPRFDKPFDAMTLRNIVSAGMS